MGKNVFQFPYSKPKAAYGFPGQRGGIRRGDRRGGKAFLNLILFQRERGLRVALFHTSNRCPAMLPEKFVHLSDEPHE